MPEKVIDKRKWDKYTGYLDVVVILVLIGCLYLMVAQAVQVGYYDAASKFTEDPVLADEYSNAWGATMWGFTGSCALLALVVFWIFYRYFKARAERRRLL